MARRIPENRFEDLVAAACEVFIARGYRLTQMQDVAEAVGVAKGTLYGYVESKEALFALCLANADRGGAIERPATLPVPTPPPGQLVRQITRGIQEASEMPHWTAAMQTPRSADPRSELESVVRELYELNEANHRSIKLIDRCQDHPELGPIWQKLGREVNRQQLFDYLTLRIEGGQLRRVKDLRLAARFIIETIATWAIHIKWDRSPESFDPDEARENAILFIVEALALTH
jgi:AcrR family transcriptional regulator